MGFREFFRLTQDVTPITYSRTPATNVTPHDLIRQFRDTLTETIEAAKKTQRSRYFYSCADNFSGILKRNLRHGGIGSNGDISDGNGRPTRSMRSR